jgi:large subunit ribosomal protein L7/L12
MSSDIEELKKKRDQLNARIQKAENLKKISDTQEDNTVKVLVGAAVLNSLKNNTNAEPGLNKLLATLDAFLTRDRDRKAVLGDEGKGSDAFRRLTQKPKPVEVETVESETAVIACAAQS